jgi:spore photoproduct lyase
MLNNFARYGINKEREIKRLLFELSKMGISPKEALSGVKSTIYADVKKHLLRLRYPENFNTTESKNFYLPKLNINPLFKANLDTPTFYPKNIYYDTTSAGAYLTGKVKKLFSKANFCEISSLKTFQKNNKFDIAAYNSRRENLFIVKENYDFAKPCPCAKGAKCCGYSLINTGFGCLYDCAYCFLQGYQNVGGIILPSNIEDFFAKAAPVNHPLFRLPRVGSGEFTDSLIFDDITDFSLPIIDFYSKAPCAFEFKTKSTNIDNILKCAPAENIVIAWSLNTPEMITENEYLTPSLEERLSAAQKVREHGFKTAFHFDPLIYYNGWEKDYAQTVETIFKYVKPACVEWISLGTLRMPKELKTVIENRFPENKMLNGELLLDGYGKLRYNAQTRIKMYKHLNALIKKMSPKTVVYLCMESDAVWKEIF